MDRLSLTPVQLQNDTVMARQLSTHSKKRLEREGLGRLHFCEGGRTAHLCSNLFFTSIISFGFCRHEASQTYHRFSLLWGSTCPTRYFLAQPF